MGAECEYLVAFHDDIDGGGQRWADVSLLERDEP
jgi:hypothetical protein